MPRAWTLRKRMSGAYGKAQREVCAAMSCKADSCSDSSAMPQAPTSSAMPKASTSCAMPKASTLPNAAPAASGPPSLTMSPERAKRSGKTPISRTRGSSSASRGKASNSRGEARTATNGHGPTSIPRGEAASDDASGTSVATAAPSAAARTDREAYAEVALPRRNGAEPRVPEEPAQEVSAGVAWMQDGAAFVNAMFARVNPLDVGARLLRSDDEKVAQRAWERMLEMKWGKSAAMGEETPQVVLDLPRPNRE
jgi:hypothetical protein